MWVMSWYGGRVCVVWATISSCVTVGILVGGGWFGVVAYSMLVIRVNRFDDLDFPPSDMEDGMFSPSEVEFSRCSLIVGSFPGVLLRVFRPCMRGVDWRCCDDVASMEVDGLLLRIAGCWMGRVLKVSASCCSASK